MDIAGLSLMTNKEVVVLYERTILDVGWLEGMMHSCEGKSAAKAHYTKEYYKELERLDALKEIMIKRRLLQ